MPQFLRDNSADPRVAADLDRLAAAYNADSAAEPWWRVAWTHVTRYRTLYGVAVAVLAVLVLRSPVPLPPAEEEAEATATLPTSDSQEVSAGLPSDDGFVAPAIGPLDPAPGDGLVSPLPPSLEPSAGPVAKPASPALRISEHGYASVFAGTPLEQPPPPDGLPVQILAGGATKLSFVRLAGGGRSLRLAMVTSDGANINDAGARVQACRITTSNWAPKRGMTLEEAPDYDAGACVEGARDANNVWTFTFVLDNPLDRNGWALVPVTDADATFQVTLSARAA